MAVDPRRASDSPSPGAPRSGPGEDDHRALRARMDRVAHKILVLSGKGGVGKSTVAVNLAAALAQSGQRVGLLDIDIHGPSTPKLLGMEGQALTGDETGLQPKGYPCGPHGIRVISIGFLFQNRDEAVIWRGPRKYHLIRQFLEDVQWGDLDWLVVDAPPGTGDEPLAVVQLLERADGAVVVTTPQEVAVQDVRRCVVFCRQLDLPVIGVIENMSGFTCPKCGEVVRIFGADGGRNMAQEMGVPFLGSLPIDPEVVRSGEQGTPIVLARPDSETAQVFHRLSASLQSGASLSRK
ncbi:MAG: Mrp/NBP35 family ATP-binding protein [Deltaproteobacteria bacterium]|nr:Mrp/NBP35 family ATP-binding protein [Deltaproteobacteria bacterium]